MWFTSPHPTLYLTEGNYILDVYVWCRNTRKPKKITSSFYTDKETEIALQKRITQKSTSTRRIFLNTKLDRNMVLTKRETSKLLR